MKPTRKERIQAMIDNVQETADFWQDAIDEGTMKGEMLENAKGAVAYANARIARLEIKKGAEA